MLPIGDSEIKRAIERIAITNIILKRSVNKLFSIEDTYHDTTQTDRAREQKLKREVAVIGEQKRKYECWLRKHWEGKESLNITDINPLIIFNKAWEIFWGITRVLSIRLTRAATSASVERLNSKLYIA